MRLKLKKKSTIVSQNLRSEQVYVWMGVHLFISKSKNTLKRHFYLFIYFIFIIIVEVFKAKYRGCHEFHSNPPQGSCRPEKYNPFRFDAKYVLNHQAVLYSLAKLPEFVLLSLSNVENFIPLCEVNASPVKNELLSVTELKQLCFP